MAENDQKNGNGEGEDARATRVLTDIAPRAWEHPADRAALAALRKIPVFDDILRKLFGFFGERPIRLAFLASSVRVSERQFPRVHDLYRDVLQTLDAPEDYPLFVSQTPIVNAGAYGMDDPFIILNSGTVKLLDDEQLSYVMGHEVGHIMSDHVLYRTMTVLLIQLASMGFPIVGLAARAVLGPVLQGVRRRREPLLPPRHEAQLPQDRGRHPARTRKALDRPGRIRIVSRRARFPRSRRECCRRAAFFPFFHADTIACPSLPPVSAAEGTQSTAITADSPAPSLASLYSTNTSVATTSFRPPKPPGLKFA